MAVMRKRGEKRGGGTPIKEREKECKKLEKSLSSVFLQEIREALQANSPIIDVSYQQAIAYLRREAITLPPDTPRGIVVVAFQGHPLGIAKNVGNRANNLYPKSWRILSTHVPNQQPTIIMNSK